ncbi:MAG: c-type cytochrome [Bryobacterales bacterium]|nr:c-type cytochrome [Bryobacterales bacterium]
MMRLAVPLIAISLLLLGCGKSKPPYPPDKAIKTFRLPEGFRIELAAAEPEVVDPVAFAFDERGRLLVVEMPDYPLSPDPKGRVKILEDRNGDGRFEHATVFVDGLHMPTGVMPWRNGVLITSPPDIIYAEDTTGDGKADVRKVVLTGFAATNPQLRVNGLLYGVDNWIYGAYPRVPTPRRYAKEFGDPGQPVTFPGQEGIPAVELRSRDFRFHPERLKVESVSGNSQFGNAFDHWGNRFTLWNNDHVRHVVVPAQTVARNPYFGAPPVQNSASDHENAATVYPVTENPFHIHDSQIGHFTSSCGLSVYTGGEFPEFESSSFTCEPVHNLVHCDRLVPNGATFTAKRAYQEREFLASTDAWFRPVFSSTGPDGALYVADYYRFTVEHPEYVPPELLKQIDFEPKHKVGRIWRVVHESQTSLRKADMANANTAALVGHLSDKNLWWRLTAQRLLVDRQDAAAVPALEKVAAEGESPLGRIHALWTLDGYGKLSDDLVLRAMGDPHPAVREHGVRLSEARIMTPVLQQKVLALADDSDDRVQFRVAAVLSALPPERSFQPLAKIALRHVEDQWFQVAALSGAADNPAVWHRQAMAHAGFASGESKGKAGFLERIASIASARGRDADIAAVLTPVAGNRSPGAAWWRAATLRGLAGGARPEGAARLAATQNLLVRCLVNEDPAVAEAALRFADRFDWRGHAAFGGLLRNAEAAASNEAATPELRAQALGALSLDPSGRSVELIGKYLDPKWPETVQVAAVGALARMADPRATGLLIERFRGFTGPMREVAVNAFFQDRSRLPVLLDAIGDGKVQTWALGPARTRQLMQARESEIRERAEKLLAEAQGGDRKAVYERYLPAIRMDGNPERGKQVFLNSCADCHRVGDIGHDVGPDLLSVTTHYKETLLANILMPNQAIETGYEEYLVETTDGRSITGILAKETPASLVLKRARGEEDVVQRASIAGMRSLSVSPMPEDLENNITIEQMADLLAYIKSLR